MDFAYEMMHILEGSVTSLILCGYYHHPDLNEILVFMTIINPELSQQY